MANSKKKSTQKGAKKTKPQRAMVVRPTRGLDAKAAAYASLLADPCTGPLVSGPFGDGGGGLISRFEVDFLNDNLATSTASCVSFVPSFAQTFTSTAAITSDTAGITFAGVAGYSPGQTFLLSNASSFRCLSACIQAYWPGSELTRAGVLSLGQFPTAAVPLSAAGTVTTSAIRSGSTYVERVPDIVSEVVWRPNNFDLEWSQVGATTVSALADKASCLTITAAGIPVSTGIRYRIVAVYEWLPSTGGGLVQPMGRNQVSRSTFNEVVAYLDGLGDWMYHGALSVGKAASKVYAGVRAIGQVAYGGSKMVAMLAG